MGSTQKVDTLRMTDILETEVSKLHLIAFNRLTFYGEKPSVKYAAIRKKARRIIFLNRYAIDKLWASMHLTENADFLEKYIFDVHDFHSEAIQSLCSGRPISRIIYELEDLRFKYFDDVTCYNRLKKKTSVIIFFLVVLIKKYNFKRNLQVFQNIYISFGFITLHIFFVLPEI